ncbi:MAG: hypothetical protein K0U59_06785 [Gammaproteobacteria bacterium]|nr:hypothetical protein [Gammaproteobacteria bacterium]
MLELNCKLLQSIHLGELFTITPVWMGDDTVKLYIVACNGGQLTRIEPVLPTENQIWLEESNQNTQPPSDSQPLGHPNGNSEPTL